MNIPFGKQGFTLIEILVVTSIISLLSSVVITATAGARDKAEVANGQRFDRNVMSVLADNLVAEWTFEDTGNLGSDTSGFNQNLSAGGSASAGTSKRNTSNYLSCTGGVSCLGVATPVIALDMKKANVTGLTISAWIKSKTRSGFNNFISANWSGGNATEFLFTDNAGDVQFFYGPTTDVTDRIYAGSNNKIDQWYNVVVTLGINSAGSKTAIIYINGKLANKRTMNLTGLTSLYTSYPAVRINPSGNMDIDDVRIYSNALSEVAVLDLYNAESRIARK